MVKCGSVEAASAEAICTDHLRTEIAVVEPKIIVAMGEEVCAALDGLERLGYEIARWRDLNVFFGGVQAVEVRSDGTLAAAGDPRRGGHGIVVE